MIDGIESSFVTMYLASKQISNLKIVTMNEKELKWKLPKLISCYDDIVINSVVGPHLEFSIKYADKLMVLFSPADLNLWNNWKLTNIERYTDAVLDENPKLKAHSFVTKSDENHKDCEVFVKILNRSRYLEYMSFPDEESQHVNELEQD